MRNTRVVMKAHFSSPTQNVDGIYHNKRIIPCGSMSLLTQDLDMLVYPWHIMACYLLESDPGIGSTLGRIPRLSEIEWSGSREMVPS